MKSTSKGKTLGKLKMPESEKEVPKNTDLVNQNESFYQPRRTKTKDCLKFSRF